MVIYFNKRITCCIFTLSSEESKQFANEVPFEGSCIAWMFANEDTFEVVVGFYDNIYSNELDLIVDFIFAYKNELKKIGIKSVDDVIALLDSCDKTQIPNNQNSCKYIIEGNIISTSSPCEKSKVITEDEQCTYLSLQNKLKKIYKNIKGKELMPERISKAYAGFLEGQDNITSIQTGTVDSSRNSKILMQKNDDGDNTLHYDEKGNLNYKDVQNYLLNKLGIQKGVDSKKFILNKETGRTVNISISSINKMLSAKATKKSEANGLSKNQHNEAVANVVTLFENAHLESKHGDRNKSPDIKSIENYISKFKYDDSDRIFTAFFTVKTHTDENTKDKLYSIELRKIENASDKNWVENPDITELSHVRGFNNTMTFDVGSVNDSIGIESDENILKQINLTAEEKVAEKSERIDNTYTFSDFTETDVENMLDSAVYYFMFAKDAMVISC